MSSSRNNQPDRSTGDYPEYLLTNPLPKHFEQIQELCRRVYPFSKPWSIEQLESHRSYFPDGQLIVVESESEKVVGLAFSLIIDWNDYSPQDNWQDFTSGGFFHNHNPRKGKTLYGAEVMVDPECRGRGIGKMLYRGRQEIVAKYQLKRIRAGARLRGYANFKEKFSPDDYVKQVIARKIYDPTLSFQLGQGFQVIDVAPNYLFNDPESLGYAAVIEWLNPATTTAGDAERQRQSIEAFLGGEKNVPHFLPRELRHLVRISTTALGKAIRELEGEAFLRKLEAYREQLKQSRNKSKRAKVLKVMLDKLSGESADDLMRLAHAFSLQLELVNVCEAAYRTWRQRQKPLPHGIKHKLNLTYVLTAHPTESRPKTMVETLATLQAMLVERVHNRFLFNEHALLTKVRILWLQAMTKKQKPSVMDEAEYLYSLALAPDILDFILLEKPGYDLKLRSWVGGDKDGHPGVDKTVMKTCLERSRAYLLDYASQKLLAAIADLSRIEETRKVAKSEADTLRSFLAAFKGLQQLTTGDGTKIKTWSVKFRAYLKRCSLFVKEHEQIVLLSRLLEIFPAFVLPLELREDAGLIKEALGPASQSPIKDMLGELGTICGALDLTSYARGLVISHCESDEDIANGAKLIDLACKTATLPVIPLFESREALSGGKKILKTWLKSKKNLDRVYRHWGAKFEVMLGYSDSAKETGVLPSRLLIVRAMHDIDRVLKSLQITPIFFHGSGGSVARGGGSLKEQIAWWSQGAIENPKMTIQGEMIQRLFASKEILNSQCTHLTIEASRRKMRKIKLEASPELDLLATQAGALYHHLVHDKERLKGLLAATPYRYLDVLQIGSRPSKRPSTEVSMESLRAIPWVLCWTQTRILLPTWWGIGSAWSRLHGPQRANLKALFARDPFFSSFVKTLGFTLAKVELDVWELYFDGIPEVGFLQSVRQEYNQTVAMVHEISGEKTLLWHRPWLEESIKLRSSHIHILNLIQILAMRRSDEALLRQTIVGIACGMLTTG